MVGALLLVCMLGGNARAGASSDGRYFALAGVSCAAFVNLYWAEIAARNANHHVGGDLNFTNDFIAARYYVTGWLSAYNMLTPDTFNIVPNGTEGAIFWLNNFCTKNPLKNLDDGLQALVVEAYPSRQQNAPGQWIADHFEINFCEGIEMADILEVKGFRRATSSNAEKIAYANVHLACWNGPVKFEFAVPDAATDHQLLESTRARLIELFEDATAQLREGSIPFP
jgi:hypothetical protein